MNDENLMEKLNPEQLAAVTHADGPLMIIAGAGTGKTMVITQRIAWLVEQNHAKPDEILALTFTEKAATEMEERVDRLLPMGYVDLWISTFHSFCERILRDHAIEIGLPHEFQLLDEVQTLLLMRKNFERFELDYYRPRGNPTRFLKALMTHFSRAKDELITPQMYLEHSESLQMDADTAEGVAAEDNGEELAEIARVKEVANAYHTYQQILLENNSFDFADLVNYTLELFKKRPKIREQYQKHFKFILVDEFQDTNKAQYELVKLLTNEKQNITVVGDDDQSIYKFRGASLSNIMEFRTDFPKAKNIVLTTNYRSTKAVLDQAYTLIQQNNPERLEVKEKINKQLSAHREDEGRVEHLHCATLDDEVKTTVQKIIDLKQAEQCAWSDFAILVRANDSADPFISLMDRSGIPYKFLAMSGLYTKPLILDALAWLRVINQPHESPALYRIFSHPQLGISELAISELTLFTRRKACSLYDAAKAAQTLSKIDPEDTQRLHEILDTLSVLRTQARRLPANELFVEVMKQSGLLANISHQSELAQQEDYALLNQFYQRIKAFESNNDDRTLFHFLQEFDHERDAGEVGNLKTDPEQGPDVVNVMTVHASKGLEFKYVFIVNLVEQRFPSTRRSEVIGLPKELIGSPPADKDQHVAEERRLFYVALTRARDCVFLLSAEDYGGVRKRKPSRFLLELEIEPKAGEKSQASEQVSLKKTNQVQVNAPQTISFTQIAAFSNCPLQYKFAHILKVPVFGRHSLSFGKTMHNTLHAFMTQLVNQQNAPQASLFEANEEELPQLPSTDDLLKIYDEHWIDEWYPSDAIRTEYREQGRESLLDYHAQLSKEMPEIFSLEKGFTLKLAGVTIKGRIDRIDSLTPLGKRETAEYEIIDYKTGKPKEKLSWEDKRQLVLYQLAAETCFDPPLKVKKLTFHYLEDNSMVSFEATEKDKEKLEDQISSTVDAITTSDFKPKPGFHCKYCDFKDICEFAQS